MLFPPDDVGDFHFKVIYDYGKVVQGCGQVFSNGKVPYQRSVEFYFAADEIRETYFFSVGFKSDNCWFTLSQPFFNFGFGEVPTLAVVFRRQSPT